MEVYNFGYQKKKKSFLSGLSVNTQIIILNIILFIVFSILIRTNILTWDYIAIKPSNIFEGKYIWTFLTSMFMHGGLFHLFVNMFSLFFVGSLIQKLLGPKRYLSVYVMFIPIPIKIKYAAPGILILLWLISVLGEIPIGNTAHLGGLIVGLIYGFYLR